MKLIGKEMSNSKVYWFVGYSGDKSGNVSFAFVLFVLHFRG